MDAEAKTRAEDTRIMLADLRGVGDDTRAWFMKRHAEIRAAPPRGQAQPPHPSLPRAGFLPSLPPASAAVAAAPGAEGAGVEERRRFFGAAGAASATFSVGRDWGGVPSLAAAYSLDGGGFAAGLGPPPRPVVLWRRGGA
ncbi:hypothetical protein QYE76_022328 [Lolium multiflorum]|uniref:Uncharacterized protein n=1 Tax=Lolium multiflorum TaxID=4521 RepID=A0AAD8RA38_LOLMU|nr:hypothetical protein QYE76_022328 [Lolium multiflorum]